MLEVGYEGFLLFEYCMMLVVEAVSAFYTNTAAVKLVSTGFQKLLLKAALGLYYTEKDQKFRDMTFSILPRPQGFTQHTFKVAFQFFPQRGKKFDFDNQLAL